MLPNKLKLNDAVTRGYITKKEYDFVNQLHVRQSPLSEKQINWLNDIKKRIENKKVIVDVFAAARECTVTPSDIF